MSHSTPSPTTDETAPTHSAAAEKAERTAAILLWVVVGGALVYGVSQTAIRVTALFM